MIELMPFGGGECAALSIKRYVSNIETRHRVEVALGPLLELAADNPSDEARNYTLPGASGVVGFHQPDEPVRQNSFSVVLPAAGRDFFRALPLVGFGPRNCVFTLR